MDWMAKPLKQNLMMNPISRELSEIMSELSEPSELKPSEPDFSSVNEQAWIEDPMSLEDMNTDSKISIIHDKKRARFPIRLYKNGTGIAAQVHDCVRNIQGSYQELERNVVCDIRTEDLGTPTKIEVRPSRASYSIDIDKCESTSCATSKVESASLHLAMQKGKFGKG
ncbi:hypothetical protein DFH09DRAFT_1100671 [Mycena vulgaris]|nr:hypothetical protein DFH09DRAFT_1100671 [Mycena vulgaris]